MSYKLERAAMQQAIEFIVDCEYGKAELALREALAEPELNLNCKSVQKRLATSWGYVKAEQAEQEPVAWMEDSIEFYASDNPSSTFTIPPYTAPVSIESAVLAEREACAKVCDCMSNTEANMNKTWRNGCSDAAAAIRARG